MIGVSLVSFNGVIFTWFFVILNFLLWYLRIWTCSVLFETLRFTASKVVLHLPARFGILVADMILRHVVLAGGLPGQVGFSAKFLFWQGYCLNSEIGLGRWPCSCLEKVRRDSWLVALPKCICSVGSAIACSLLPGFPVNRSVFYTQKFGRTENTLPNLSEARGEGLWLLQLGYH